MKIESGGPSTRPISGGKAKKNKKITVHQTFGTKENNTNEWVDSNDSREEISSHGSQSRTIQAPKLSKHGTIYFKDENLANHALRK